MKLQCNLSFNCNHNKILYSYYRTSLSTFLHRSIAARHF